MTRLTIILAGGAVIAGGLAALPTPAVAQSDNSLSEIIVYGTDPCPRSTDDKVVICARKPEARSEEHTSELQSQSNLVCRLLLEKKKKKKKRKKNKTTI